MNIHDVTNMLGLTSHQPEERPVVNTEIKPKIQESPEETEPRKTLYKWSAASRAHLKNMNPKKMKTLMIIGIAICVLLVAMQEFFLIFGILSVIFVSYMLGQAPMEEVTYEITNHGVRYDTMFYPWSTMRYFFVTTEVGTETVAIDMLNTLPARLYLTLNTGDKRKVSELLENYVNYLQEEPKTFVDKAYDSVMDKLDLES